MRTLHEIKASATYESRKAYSRAYHIKHKVRLAEHSSRWRQQRRPILRIKAWFRRQHNRILYPEKRHRNQRTHTLKKKYRMTHEEYLELLASQGGVCAICRRPEWRKNRTRYLCVDHQHGTSPPKVRALLCHGCNSALGQVKENVETLRRMIAYLERHGSA